MRGWWGQGDGGQHFCGGWVVFCRLKVGSLVRVWLGEDCGLRVLVPRYVEYFEGSGSKVWSTGRSKGLGAESE
jgi:hypothetical protein